MRKRSRVRRILKWAGLIGCVLIVMAWGVSLRWWVARVGSNTIVGLRDGNVLVYRDGDPPWIGGGWDAIVASPGVYRYGFFWPIVWLRPLPLLSQVHLPCWLPLIVLAIPTAILWHRDCRRRIPPGHCQKCGYDLTGNESGLCWECGTTI